MIKIVKRQSLNNDGPKKSTHSKKRIKNCGSQPSNRKT